MSEMKHPSAFALEAWTVEEQSERIESHLQSCAQCRNIVDTLEIDRQVFLEEEDAEAFLNRPEIAQVIESQTKENKKRRRRASREELSQSLPYTPEESTDLSMNSGHNVIDVNSRHWMFIVLIAMAVLAAVYFFRGGS